MSVTLKLTDRDAKLVAEVLMAVGLTELKAEGGRVAMLSTKFGSRYKPEAVRLSAAFETAVQANLKVR